jgi:hypothetical protein
MTAAPPTIALLGAPGTGAPSLAAALRAHVATHVAHIVCSDLPLSGAALTLLMGLDLPCPGEQQAGQEAADACLRSALAEAGTTYRVVYGRDERRVANALCAIKSIASNPYPASAKGNFDTQNSGPDRRAARHPAWNCERCSDPACERRLFTALTAA